MYGWTGQRLKLDLTASSYEIEKPPVEYYKRWLGGRGFNTDVLGGTADALCFAAGALVGTFAPLSGNTIASARGRGGRYGHAGVDSTFGAMMKYAGYDQMVVKGKANTPVYVFIDGDGIEFRDAGHLWGLGVREATLKILEENVDPDIEVVSIGPAGENLVDFAGIVSAFKVRGGGGTPGLGAVMGGMNLKAIAVKGTGSIPIAHPAQLARTAWEIHERVRRWIADPAFDGDCSGASAKDGGKGDIGKKLRREPLLFKRISCWSCPAACGTSIYITEGKYAGLSCGIPDIENLAGSESGLKSFDPDITDIIALAVTANDLGMDIGKAVTAVPQAVEALKKIPGEENINSESLTKILNMIARRAIKSFDQTFTKVWPPAGPPEATGQLKVDATVNKETRDRLITDIVGGCRGACLRRWGDTWKDLYSPLFKHVTGIDIGDKEITAVVERILVNENAPRAGKGEK